MSEEQTDVQPVEESSTPTPENVEAQEIVQPETTELEPTSLPSEQGNSSVTDEAPIDRPWENVAREAQRKNEKLSQEVMEMKNILTTIQQNVEKPEEKYTTEQLRELKRQNPEYATWCDGEIDKLNREATVKEVRAVFEQEQRQKQEQQLRANVFNNVAQSFPQAFKKDAQGRVTGEWDMSNPLTQRIDAYMKLPQIANNPEGLLAAAKMAYADVAVGQSVGVQAKIAKTQAEMKALQSKTLVEGGGNSAGEVSSHKQAVNRAVESGNIGDAKDAMKSIFQAQGIIQ